MPKCPKCIFIHNQKKLYDMCQSVFRDFCLGIHHAPCAMGNLYSPALCQKMRASPNAKRQTAVG